MSLLPDTPVEELKNLGPVSRQWLATVGIHTRNDLERVGSIEAFLRIRDTQEGIKPSLNLLYAMEAALRDLHWTQLPAELKRELRAAIH
jgi:DNA transformation protein and related proteins